MTYKINTLEYFLRRIYKLCDRDYVDKNINLFYKMARENKYPVSLINKLVCKYKNNTNITRQPNLDIAKINPPTYHSIIYMPTATERLQKLFKIYNIILAPKTNNSLQCLYNNKDTIPSFSRQNVVYAVKCLNCPDPPGSYYIGQTCRKIKIRLSEHERDVKNKNNNTGLSTHCVANSHKFDLDKFRILATEPITTKRLLIEMCFIRSYGESAVNFHRDSDTLSRAFDALISRV